LRRNLGEDEWFNTRRPSLTAHVLGFGAVGRHVVAAALKMGNTGFVDELEKRGGNPLVRTEIFNSTHTIRKAHVEAIVPSRLKGGGRPQLLVDSSWRRDLSQQIVGADEIAALPSECVIVDVAAVRYAPGIVKGIEGLPTGDEQQYLFRPDDDAWQDPLNVPPEHQLPWDSRRTTLSSFAWPSYGSVEDRRANMHRYARQLLPVIAQLCTHGAAEVSHRTTKPVAWDYTQAIVDATLRRWLARHVTV
jgi:hypothetical protein